MGSDTRIVLNCPQCGVQVLVELSLAGQTINCPQCGTPISVPSSGYQVFRPPTIWQRANALSLGIQVPDGISGVELERLIQEARGDREKPS